MARRVSSPQGPEMMPAENGALKMRSWSRFATVFHIRNNFTLASSAQRVLRVQNSPAMIAVEHTVHSKI